jgi:hypothetical protein
MQGRSGPFWDAIQGRAPMPPAAATLGVEFVDADVEADAAVIATATATARVIALSRAPASA